VTTTDTQELEQVLAHTVRQLGEVAAGSLQMKLPRPFQRPTAELVTALAALADRGEIFRHPTARTKFLAFDARAEVRTLVAGALGPKALTEAEVKKVVAKKGASLGLGRASGPLTTQALKTLVREGVAYEHRRPPPPSAPTRPPPKTVRYASVPQPPIELGPYVRRSARELRTLVKRLSFFGATTAEALRAFAAELGFGAPSPERTRDKATPVREVARPPAPVVETRPPLAEVRPPLDKGKPPAIDGFPPATNGHPPARRSSPPAFESHSSVPETSPTVVETSLSSPETHGAPPTNGKGHAALAIDGMGVADEHEAPPSQNIEGAPGSDEGGSDDEPTPDESQRRLLRALDEVAAGEPNGALLLVERVRERAGLGKKVFDRAALDLVQAEQVVLHYHDHPTSLPSDELERLVLDEDGTYYIGIGRWRKE
jgi:hypothetical protein